MSKHNRQRRQSRVTAVCCPKCGGVFKAEHVHRAEWEAFRDAAKAKRVGAVARPAVYYCKPCEAMYWLVRPSGRVVRARLVPLTPAERFEVEVINGDSLEKMPRGLGGGVMTADADGRLEVMQVSIPILFPPG